PPLKYAFTITSYSQAIGPPVPLSGYAQTVGIGVNSTIFGPLLNATLVTLSFTEQSYNNSTNSNISYSSSQANAIYITSDGMSFSLRQTGAASSDADLVTLFLGIGGVYAYLSQYVIICHTPITSGSDFNSTTSTQAAPSAASTPAPSTNIASAPIRGRADCFAVGGL
ncbi:MAG: hypothetical protein CYPHOPRED_003521, partial [Cyphobasidiales sp. Tagirdzhanova-0007]